MPVACVPVRAAALTLLAVTAAALASGCFGDVRTSRPEPGEPVAAASVAFPASDVLRSWDRARSRAFAAGDVGALRRLYVDHAEAGTSDVRLLRAYLRRDLRVQGMRMQLLEVDVLHHDARRLLVRVTDRLSGAVAVGRGMRVHLPRDQASTRVMELRRAGPSGSWRVASVRSGPRPAAR